MLSTRARITLVAAVLTGVILVLAGVLLVVALDESLTRGSDSVSRTRLREVAAQAERGELPPRLGEAGNGVVQVVSTTGEVLAASTNVEGQPAISDVRPSGSDPVVFTLRDAPDDDETEDYRVWAGSVTTPSGPATVYVGDSLESVREATGTLRRTLSVGVPATLVVLVIATWWLVGRAFRPVEAIRARVSHITDDELDQRVPVPRTEDEVARLARTMNAMLTRLEGARRRERDFVADASHELLSPLAASRAMLEVGPADGRDWGEVVTGLLSENASMEALVRDLLFLARDSSAPEPASPVALDLDDVVLEETARLRPLTDVIIDTSSVSAGPVRGDREELRRLVRNLLENAVRHARATVRLSLVVHADRVVLDVQDDGPGVEPAVGDRVFDRFYRADAVRARSAGASGLGLAIARSIATRHGGTLELGPPGPGACFVLTLPAEGRS